VAFTKEITRLEKSNVKLSVTVPKDDVRAKYDDMLKDYTKNMQLPGFRKGKVPREVLERKFGDALKNEAVGRIIEDALGEIFKDESISRYERPLAYSTPELQGEPQIDFQQDFQFSVVYDVLPEVKIGQWKGISVEYPYASVENEDIDRELGEIQERNAIVMDREDDACAQNGDVADIDYQIFNENGEAVPDLKREDFVFTIGTNSPYQFDNDIIGMKKGETKEFEKKFADDLFDASLAGQSRKVQINLNTLKEKKLPDLDDELAQDVDEKYNTLDDLKNSIRERLEKGLERRLREKKISELLKKIMENTPVTIPESLVQAEVESRWNRLARMYGTDVEMLKKLMNVGGQDGEDKWRANAEISLHSRMIVETLIEEQKFEVSDEDVEKEMERIAVEGGVDINEVKKDHTVQDIAYLKEDIKERRLFDILLGENTFNPVKKENYLDFMSDNG